ncbi:N5-glutamine methyltransferase family protein [Arsenicicoccus sp. oral taxon 190]|uniref:N5-glutamine methyltransferase family protein n=1 Tax=Arsenicicoccus sp. oral taxon 190 TaxID=1658671 RepID=UPI00067A333F|nr:class I SAM-dependent methyltransferase [Arsenicicoccus sp. oral taxon 190]AKT51151.1 SAM-dependent methyltransferase [Arsenicicoccus sp. oral taxon 190]
MTVTPLPEHLDLGAVASLRADLAAVGYTVEGVQAALGPVASAALHREQALPALRATAEADGPAEASTAHASTAHASTADPVDPVDPVDPADSGSALRLLVRLFTLGRPVPRAALDRALRQTTTAGLESLGLVLADDGPGGEVQALLDLRPYGDEEHTWWVASDLGEVARGEQLPTHHVLGIGGASATLASWTPRRRVAHALDLGTGCGIQALHLASHADQVVATDISRRALAIARLNAALADQAWDLRHGDMLAPVAGETFDLVVSNPPFVITPRVAGVPAYDYRDGGRAGDAVVQGLVRGVGAHLRPGGVAHFLGNWEVRHGETWRDVWQRWLDGTGLDAWVVQRETQDPAEYAELWVRDGGTSSGPEFERLYGAWLDDFAARGVARIGFGVVTLQRPARERPPWVDLVEVTGPVAAPMGPTIEAGMVARTWLAEHDDAAVLDTAWRLAEDVTEERFGRPGAQDPAIIRVRQGGGLGVVRTAGTALAAYLSVADGSLTARQALTAIAALLERDTDEVVAETLPVIQDLVKDGLLLTP